MVGTRTCSAEVSQSRRDVSPKVMCDALPAETRRTLMADKRGQLDDSRCPVSHVSVRRPAVDVEESPVATVSVEEFLQAFPAVAHELSEALTAISAYLTGSRHIFERGGQLEGIQYAIEQADTQAARANDTLRRLRESFGQLGRLRPNDQA